MFTFQVPVCDCFCGELLTKATNQMKIKVCGITQLDQLHQLSELGVDYAGFIFYPPSPRSVERSALNGNEVKKSKVPLYKVGVFVNATYDEVMRRIDEFGLDMVQLHGHETPYECQKIVAHIDVIKAFRFAENDHVMWMIKDYYGDSDFFLFDTGIPTPKDQETINTVARKFNYNRLQGLSVQKPFFLSGGIAPTDAQLVRNFLKEPVARDMVAVDINSRFETTPGVKDLQQVQQFIAEIRNM
jgi:phosphoribosylanthranilate isomerase